MIKKYAAASLAGIFIFIVLPLGIAEFGGANYDPLSLPVSGMSYYPALVTIWKQYELAGLLPPTVWRLNNANLAINSILSITVSGMIFRQLRLKSK